MDFLKGIGDFFSGWFGNKKRKRIQDEMSVVGEQAYQHAKQATPEQAQPQIAPAQPAAARIQAPAPQEQLKPTDLSEINQQARQLVHRPMSDQARFNQMRRGGMSHAEAQAKIQAEKDAINQQIRQKQAEERQKHRQEVKQPLLNQIEQSRQAINSVPNISQRQKDAINQRADELSKKLNYVSDLNNVDYKDWWTKDYERFANLNQRINDAYGLGKSIFDKTGDANKARQAIDQQLAHSDEMTRLEDEEKGYRDTAGAIALATQIPRDITKTVGRYGTKLTTSGLEALGNMTNNQALANAARQGQQALDEAVFNKLDTEYDNRLIKGLTGGVTDLGMDLVTGKAVVGALGKAGALNKVVKGADKANQLLSKQGKLSRLVGKGIQAGLGSPEAIASTATALFRHYPQNYNEVYNDARAKGVDHHQANILAHSNAVINAGIEKMNLDLSGWFKVSGATPNRGFQAIKRAVGEGAEEWTQTMSTYAIKSVYSNIDWNKALAEANESGLMGVAVGGIADQINAHLPKVLHKIDQEVDHKIDPALQPITNALVKVELKKQITKAVQPDSQILTEAMRLNDEAVKFKLASDEHGRYVEADAKKADIDAMSKQGQIEFGKQALNNQLRNQQPEFEYSSGQYATTTGRDMKKITRTEGIPTDFHGDRTALLGNIGEIAQISESLPYGIQNTNQNYAPDGWDKRQTRAKYDGREFNVTQYYGKDGSQSKLHELYIKEKPALSDLGETPSSAISAGNSIDNIAQAPENVNPDLKFKLSPEQEAFFKDSKIRDGNGNLKPMHHGTSARFNQFSPESIRQDNLGRGFYFTDNEAIANSYANRRTNERGGEPRVMETFLNVKKPFDLNHQPREIALDYLTHYFSKNGESNENAIKQANEFLDSIVNDGDVIDDNYNVVFSTAEPEFQDWVKSKGYDGLIVPGKDKASGLKGDAVVVFKPNQIKYTNNSNPTNNPDMRYKISQKSTEIQSSIDELKARHFKLTGDNDIAFNAFAEAIQDIGNIEGYYDPKTNTVHIGELAEYVLNHEVVHKTLRKHMELRPEIMQATADKFGIDNIIAEYNQKGYSEQAVNGHTLDAGEPKDVRLAVEEKVADEFNTYLEQYQKGRANYYANKVGLSPTIRAWFDRIIEGLKEFFGQADKIKQFYAQIETGKFSTDDNIGALERTVSRLEDSIAYKRSPDAAKRALAGFKMVQNGWRKRATLTQLTADSAEKYRQVTGLDVNDDAKLILTNNSINHIRNSGHLNGQGRYGKVDTNPLTEADIANIPLVFTEPDTIEVKSERGYKGRKISLTKQINKTHILGIELAEHDGDFYVITYFNKSRSPQQVQASSSVEMDADFSEEVPTSSRPKRSPEAYADNIPQTDENIKYKLNDKAQEVSDFYYNDHQSAAQLRQSLIDQLWEANKKGQGVDHIFHEAKNALDDTYMVRASNNSPFYSGYFEANGKKPSKAGITAIIDEILGIENDYPTPTMTHQMWDAIAYEYGDPEGIADAYKRLEQKQQSRQEKEKQMLENIIAESNSLKQELTENPTPIKQVIKQKQGKFKNVPLENKNHAYTKGNLYQQTTIGSADDVVRGGGAENGRRFMFGDWEMRQHTRKKNGKSFTQVERRYIDPKTGEAGDWKPYSRAAYLWHTQSDKIDQANRDQLIQEALDAAKQDGEVREFVSKTNGRGATEVQPLLGDKTIDGGLVRDPVSGEVEGNYIQVTPFGVVNQVAGKLHLTELDQIIANNSDKKAKPGLTDTYMRTIEKTAANEQSKRTYQDLYYKKTKAYAEFIKNKEEVLNAHTEQAGILEGYRPAGVKSKQFWEDVGRYTENTFPIIEGKNQQQAFAQKYGKEAAQAVERYSQYMRQQYDTLIENANAVRRMYGKDEIPYHKDYMPHMTKDGGLLGMTPAEVAANLRGDMETVGRGEIPANIAGLSESFKPTKKYNQSELHRNRKDASDYELDPRKVFEKYTDLVLYNTHMEPVIAEGRQLEAAMRAADHKAGREVLDPLSALKQGEAKVSSRQTIAVMDFVNAMAGKSNSLDRSWIDRAPEFMKLLRKLENINGANKIMGNISSTFAQALNIKDTIRDNGIRYTLQMIKNSRTAEVQAAMKKSAFLTERYVDGGEKFSKTKWQNISAGVSKATGMELVESAFVRLAWGAHYNRLKAQGLRGFELIKQVDLATERAVGGRGVGAMPQIYQSALGKVFLQFTYEVNESFKNDIAHTKGIVKGLKAGEYKKSGAMAIRGAWALVTTMVLNAIYKEFTGNAPLPDMLGAVIRTAANATKDDEDKTKDNVVRNAVGNIGTEFIKSNPALSATANMMSKSDRQQIFGNDSDFGRFDGATGVAQTIASGAKGAVHLATGDYDKAAQNMMQLLPMGSQIRKTVGGANALLKGAVTKKDKNGKERVVYEVDNKNPLNIAKGLLFGKNALNETQAHYQSKDSQVSKSSASGTDKQSQNKLFKQQMGDDYKIHKMTNKERKKAVISGAISKQKLDEIDQKARSIKQKLGMEVKEPDKYQATVNNLKLERDYLDKAGYEQAEDRALLNQQLELAEFKLKLSKNKSDRPILEAYDRMSAQGFKRFTKNDLRRFAQRQANPQDFWGKLLDLDQQQYQITGKYKLHNQNGEPDTIEQTTRGRGRRKSSKINFNSGVDFSVINTKARSVGQSIKSPARGAVSYQISNNAFTYQPMSIRHSAPRLPKYSKKR